MVKRVIKLMHSEIRGLHQAAYVLAVFAFGSQILALVRDRLLAHSFGADSELDLYYTAFRIPDLLFVLFVSVLSVYVLLPFVASARAERGEAAAAQVLAQVFTLFLGVYAVIAGILFFSIPYLIPYLFPGFAADNEMLTLLIRILLFQPFLLGISSLFGVVTQLSQRFVIFALSPLIYNLGIIFGIAVLYPYYGLPGLVGGVVIGAVGHLLVQWPLMRQSALSFGLVSSIDWSLFRTIIQTAIPRALTLSIHQLVLLLFVGVATTMTVGSVAVFQFAFNLQSVPLAIIGMSYSVAAFPVLADLFARKEREAFNNHVLTAMRHIIFWSLPIAGLFIVLRAQIVRVVLGSGEFDWSDTRLTAAVLAMFVIGLLAQSLLLLLVRAFYAVGKTRLPLYVAMGGALMSLGAAAFGLWLFALSSNLATSIASVFRLSGVEGVEVIVLATAFVVGTLIEAVVLFVLTVRTFELSWRTLLKQFGQAMAASSAGAAAAYSTLVFIVDGVNQETLIGILLQGAVAGIVGIVAIVGVYYLLGSRELFEISRSFRAKFEKQSVVAPQPEQPS